jgi:SAM-dependent methyltransferase
MRRRGLPGRPTAACPAAAARPRAWRGQPLTTALDLEGLMKHAVKLTIGAMVYVCWRLFSPRRLRAVKDQYFASHSLSFLERQLLTFDLFLTRMSTGTASCYWAGSAGSRFHAHDHHRLTLDLVAADSFYRRPMLDEFARHAAQLLASGASIVEVGCGAGGNLLYLRRRLSDSHFRYLGFDINSDVIASDRQHNSDDLSFEVRNCFTSEITVPGDLGLIFCAVLTYALEQDIERLLRGVIRNCHGRILLGLSEPILDPEAASPTSHNNLALLHGYRRIFRQLNFRQLFESFRQEEGKTARIYHAVFEFPR